MGTLHEDLSAIKEVEDKIIENKVARFAYTDEAYTANDTNGVSEYNVNNAQNIPIADPSVLKVNETVLSKGYRAQASSVTRMLLNHFFGRMSYNLNKVNDNVSNLITTLIAHRGTANGLATLDANGRIPYSQLPESAMEYKGNWNASTNTPTLADGTGDVGDFYLVSVAGTRNLGSGNIQFFVNDRVIYDGSVWSRLSAGDVKTVNNLLPTNGNVTLTAFDVDAVPSIARGLANGVAALDNQGKIPYSQVPESAILAKVYPYIYTGRNLVEVFGVPTAVQAFAKLREKSDAGDFSGLGIGDYIDIPSIVIDGTTISYNNTYENLRAEIVAFDQYYRNGDTAITYHHIIMQMKNCPFTHRVNATDTNTGGYNASELKTYLKNTVTPAIATAIGSSLKNMQRIISTHGSWAWVTEACFLPSEVECIGTKAWSDNYGYTVGNSRQWAMFQLRPDRLIKFYNGARQTWWTCSDFTNNSKDFVQVFSNGGINNSLASNALGIPFAFAI